MTDKSLFSDFDSRVLWGPPGRGGWGALRAGRSEVCCAPGPGLEAGAQRARGVALVGPEGSSVGWAPVKESPLILSVFGAPRGDLVGGLPEQALR